MASCLYSQERLSSHGLSRSWTSERPIDRATTVMDFFKSVLLRDNGTTSSHADASRQPVGSTAFAVAALRAAESSDAAPLVSDAVAKAVFSLSGPAPLLWRLATAALAWRALIKKLLCRRSFTKYDVHVDMIACRTAHLDALLTAFSAPRQIVIIGAGLDARSIRLVDQPTRRWFEVDFAAMHRAKWSLFAAAGFARPQSLECVAADLTEPGAWRRSLLESRAFDPTAATLWLLEGLTSYLEVQELVQLFDQINATSAAGSVILATFIAATRPERTAASALKMHKFFTDTPEELFDTFRVGPKGGRGNIEVTTIGQLAVRYGRASIDPNDDGYRFVRAVRGT